MLELKNIVKSYTTGNFTQLALNSISIKFRAKEFVAILGHSGSGKTTCLNIIGGLDKYDEGDLIINGKSTKNFKDADWDAYRNNSIGFVFQNYNLISHLNITDNVELGMTLSGVSASKKHRKALEVLEIVGLKDHVHKKPNQLSGGQMQRVAIARALANNPDIILADEPTGALDTNTSIQIMDLIKEISKEKLVIMVTHNSELAHRYADRIIQFKDGQVTSDSNPPDEKVENPGYKLKRTSMNFLTALKLSGKNIATKKWRTALTAFASSIGIIGIALILSLSNGFDKQISKFESDTLSGFPIMITRTTANVDSETMRNQMKERMDSRMGGLPAGESKYPDVNWLYPYNPNENNIVHTNIFTDEYINYIENINPSLIFGVTYTRLADINILHSDKSSIHSVDTSAGSFSAYPTNLNNGEKNYLESNYDLLKGNFPSDKSDLVLIINRYNKLDNTTLKAWGFDIDAETISFDNIIGKEYKIIFNDDYYIRNGDYFVVNTSADGLNKMYNAENSMTLRIAGIIRAKESNKLEVLQPGIAYSDELSKYVTEKAKDSEIVKAQKAADYNILTGGTFAEDSKTNSAVSGGMNQRGMPRTSGVSGGLGASLTKDMMLSILGANGVPSSITLYPKDFAAKEKVTEYLSAWNSGKEVDETIIYTDLAETFANLSGGIMNAITIVLVAFAAISLIVSLIMIGIITYISVLERTKEIGVLRALGARKKDITRVFNAETFIIGTLSGLLGIGIAYALTIPINFILYNITDLKNVAQLNPLHAILLIILSVSLTLLGGAIPAKMAAKKDPVEALRTE